MGRKERSKSRTLLVALAIASAVVVGGCPPFLVMDKTDNIRVENRSDLKLDLFVNFDYPDTAFARAQLNSYVDPHDNGSLTLLNRTWADLFQKRPQVSVFFAEWKRAEFYNQGRQGPQEVYATLLLTKERLDSLRWVITFPLPSGGGLN